MNNQFIKNLKYEIDLQLDNYFKFTIETNTETRLYFKGISLGSILTFKKISKSMFLNGLINDEENKDIQNYIDKAIEEINKEIEKRVAEFDFYKQC